MKFIIVSLDDSNIIGLHRLVSIDLQYNVKLTDNCLKHLTNLEKLVLGSNKQITNVGMIKLNKLHTISLRKNSNIYLSLDSIYQI